MEAGNTKSKNRRSLAQMDADKEQLSFSFLSGQI
jgi:hypothetical protein